MGINEQSELEIFNERIREIDTTYKLKQRATIEAYNKELALYEAAIAQKQEHDVITAWMEG